MINTGGEKVFPEEVEEAIKRYPGVRDAAVVGVPDPRFGERICAVVDVGDAAAADAWPTLAEHVRAAPGRATRRRANWCSRRSPRAANGKLDYKTVRAEALKAPEHPGLRPEHPL